MKKIIILLVLLPNLIFASFPFKNFIADTISKDGRMYIKIPSGNNNNIENDKLEKEQNLNKQNNNDEIKRVKRKRTSGLLGFFGSFFIIAAVLATILFFLLIKLIIDSFASWSNSGI